MCRIGKPLGVAQLVQRALQLPHGGERPGKLAPHRQGVRERPCAVVDRQRLAQRRAAGRIVAAAQLELPEPVQRVRRVGPRCARAPRGERILIQLLGPREVAGEAREAREIHQVGRRDLVTPVPPVERERRLELAARFVEVTHALRQQAEVVVACGHAARVPDPVLQGAGLGVALARRRQVARVLAHPGERHDGVRLGAHVADGGREGARPLQVRDGAVEPALGQQARADVARYRRDAGGVVDRARARQRPSPHRDRRGRSVPAVRRDARAPHAVDPDLTGALHDGPGGEPLHLPHQERVAPPYRVRGCEVTRHGELVVACTSGRAFHHLPQRVGHRVAHRERARPHGGGQLGIGQVGRQQPQRVRRRRLGRQRRDHEQRPDGRHRGGPRAIENWTSSEADQRSHPVRASTFQRYGRSGMREIESGSATAVSPSCASYSTRPAASNSESL